MPVLDYQRPGAIRTYSRRLIPWVLALLAAGTFWSLYGGIAYGARQDYRITLGEFAVFIATWVTTLCFLIHAFRVQSERVSIGVAFTIVCSFVLASTFLTYRSYHTPTSVYTPDYFERENAKGEIDRIRGIVMDFDAENKRLPRSLAELVEWCPTVLPYLLPTEKLPIPDDTKSVTEFVKGTSESSLNDLLERDGKFTYLPSGQPLKNCPFSGDASPLILYSRQLVGGKDYSIATKEHAGTMSKSVFENELH